MNRTAMICMLLLSWLSANVSADELRNAVRHDNVDLVRKLVEAGANVNETYENEFTLIYFARDPRIAEILVKHGARLNERNELTDQTPLEAAAAEYQFRPEERKRWKQIIQLYRKAGASYTLETAIYLNDIAFIKEALKKDDTWVNQPGAGRSLPLRLAAETGHAEICKLLLEHKADPDKFEEGNGYPIMVNAVPHPEVVKLLIKHGANLKRRISWIGGGSGYWIINDESTALHHAIGSENPESVKLLLQAGLDPSAADISGQTPLHVAIHCEHFLSNGNRNEKVTQTYLKIINTLLDHDASLRLTTNAGKMPMELAEELKSPQSIRDALEKKAKEWSDALDREWYKDETQEPDPKQPKK